jgi:hypothetical protein
LLQIFEIGDDLLRPFDNALAFRRQAGKARFPNDKAHVESRFERLKTSR